jgi:uncharacterized protein
MRRLRLLLLLALAASPAFADATGPQPTLAEKPLTIVTQDGKRHAFQVEMAVTPAQQETGLMFRRAVPDGKGMLFDWHSPAEMPMWMKNTLVPLDMIFIGADHRVLHIAENTVPQSLATIPSGGPVRATLEVAAGTAAKLDIRVGDRVEGGF